MQIKNAVFLTSVADAAKLLSDGVPEIAMCGKSNVGKSSFINFVTGQNALAKTSKEPGRTRLINYFSCNRDAFRLVDLPGYGFARVSDAEKKKWGVLIERYLRESKALRNVFLLLDVRRDPSDDDKMMINYLHHYAIPFTVILTKTDKLSRSAMMTRRREIANALCVGLDNPIPVSAEKKAGLDRVLQRLDEILSFEDGCGEEDTV